MWGYNLQSLLNIISSFLLKNWLTFSKPELVCVITPSGQHVREFNKQKKCAQLSGFK